MRHGSVPRNEVDLFTVGRERYLTALQADLAFIAAGGFKLRLLAGDLGYGKTHLLTVFARIALQQGFAVAHVELHAREAPLERSETIVPAIIRNTVFPGHRGIETHLRDWVQSNDLLDKKQMESWLQDTAPSLEFRALLRAAMQASDPSRSPDLIVDVVRWLDGGAPTAGLAAATGIRSAIKAYMAADILTSFIRFVRCTGISGFILLLDEADSITSLAQANRREEANQTLKRLLDNVEGRTHFEVVFATTSKFLEDEARGAQSYPALWERLRTAVKTVGFNPHSTVLRLAPLEKPELRRLGATLQQLHGEAYSWKPNLTMTQLDAVSDAAYGKGLGGPPRWFVTILIAVLDGLEANQSADFDKLLEAGRATAK